MRIVTFGEVMLRLAPEDSLRLRQVIPGRLEATFGGGELNVAVSLAYQGGESAFLTAAPDNPITDSLVQEMRKLGVDDRLVRRVDTGRFGIYFVAGSVAFNKDNSGHLNVCSVNSGLYFKCYVSRSQPRSSPTKRNNATTI